jgi:uncharacterized protein with FMN-binding domain
MKNAADKSSQPTKLTEAQTAFAQIVADASQRGFFGTTGLTLTVQDGHIQNIKVAVERMIR